MEIFRKGKYGYKKSLNLKVKAFLVPGAGLEPAHPCEYMPLKHACLPISAPGRLNAAAKLTVIF
jgi:hypothetical protein